MNSNYREEYQIALEDLEDYLKPEVFSYLLTILNVGKSTKRFPDDKQLHLQNFGGASSVGSSLQSSSPNDLQMFIKKPRSESASTLLPSLSPSQHSQVSATFLDQSNKKEGTLNGRSRKSQSMARGVDSSEFRRNVSTPYDPLIGKINQSEPLLFDRGRKLPKPIRGVREFSNPISNPLYKNYNPKGYIKNEDEIAREFITEMINSFNDWLRSFEGDLVSQDPKTMIKILRDDMELPFPTDKLRYKTL